VSSINTLLEAIRKRDKSAVYAILDMEPELANQSAEGGASPVMTAIYHGAGSALAMLVARGARLDLHASSALGNDDRVQLLLARDPAAVNAHSADGWTPLHLATFFGYPRTAELLIERGADVHALSCNALVNTPLHAALAGRGGKPVLEMLFAHGADPNARAAHGITPLHLAAARGDRHLVELLLLHGADGDARTDRGLTPGELAASQGNAVVAERLALSGSAVELVPAGI
jgi:uncharacterized protein